MYYVYFIIPEPYSEFVKFGRSESLGSRLQALQTAMPDPECVGLIKCNTSLEMKTLEFQTKRKFADESFRGEWFYHTQEVQDFYEAHTNVDIKQTLNIENKAFLKRGRKHYMENKESYIERQRTYRQRDYVKVSRREYGQRPDVKARDRDRKRRKYRDVKREQQLINEQFEFNFEPLRIRNE